MPAIDFLREHLRRDNLDRLDEKSRLAAKIEALRVLDVIRRGAEDDEPPPDERLLGADFFRPTVEVR